MNSFPKFFVANLGKGSNIHTKYSHVAVILAVPVNSEKNVYGI